MMTGGLVLLTAPTASASSDTIHKSYVCKYVGTPGVDERLQTGNNPIWVDNSSLGVDGLTSVGETFNDAHGKSVVIVANTDKLDPEPSVSDCPAPVTPPDNQTVTPLFASATPATCDAAGSLVVPEQPNGVLVTGGGVNGAGPGSYTFHYAPAEGFVFPGGTDTSKTVVVDPKLTGEACAPQVVIVTPLFPSVTAPTCETDGSLVVPEQPNGVVVTGGGAKGAGPGSYTFHFAPAEGFAFPAGTDTTKTVVVDSQLTGEACAPHVTTVTPVYASVTAPSCDAAGSLVVPVQPAGVVVTGVGANGAGPGTYDFSYAPDQGFVFPAETVTTQHLTVLPKLTGDACVVTPPTDVCNNIAGDQASMPDGFESDGNGGCVEILGVDAGRHPNKPPVVQGISNLKTPAVAGTSVPSSVDAGLAGAPEGDARGLVGQALLGGGLLLLVGAGWSGLGRRRHGARQI